MQGYYNKLKGRLYGLLCEKEKEGAWEKFLDTILLELMDCGEDKKQLVYDFNTNISHLMHLNGF